MFGSVKDKTTTTLVKHTTPIETLVKRQRYFKDEYPCHVPAFVQFNGDSMIHRYVLPRDSTFGHFLVAFRRKIQLRSTEALMPLLEKEVVAGDGKVTISNFQAPSNKTIDSIASDYLHLDGYLYINMTLENTFG
jgi:hypothetical protein